MRPPSSNPVRCSCFSLGAQAGRWVASNWLLWGLLLALLVWRRLRQLVVVVMAWILQGLIIQYLLAPVLRRPRPFGGSRSAESGASA